MVLCRRPLILASVVAVAAFSLLAAGCGGGGSPGVASVASSTTAATTTTTQNGLLAFSACMRSNGMPNFPDPQRFVGGNVKLTIHQLVAGNPHFQAALNACDHLLPTTAAADRRKRPSSCAPSSRTGCRSPGACAAMVWPASPIRPRRVN